MDKQVGKFKCKCDKDWNGDKCESEVKGIQTNCSSCCFTNSIHMSRSRFRTPNTPDKVHDRHHFVTATTTSTGSPWEKPLLSSSYHGSSSSSSSLWGPLSPRWRWRLRTSGEDCRSTEPSTSRRRARRASPAGRQPSRRSIFARQCIIAIR